MVRTLRQWIGSSYANLTNSLFATSSVVASMSQNYNPSITPSPMSNEDCPVDCVFTYIDMVEGRWSKKLTPLTFGTIKRACVLLSLTFAQGTVHLTVNTFRNEASTSTEWLTGAFVQDGETQTAFRDQYNKTLAISEILPNGTSGVRSAFANTTKTWANGA